VKAILLPLNLGPRTLGQFEEGLRFAKQMCAPLILLHVVRKQSYDNGTFSAGTEVHDRVVQEARMILEQLSRKAICSGITSKIMILDGNPAQVILETAQKTATQMILLGTSCNNERFISTRILEEAPCPVVTSQNHPAESVEAQPA
jgi:nucleotide-binding universal stress UspA family protein